MEVEGATLALQAPRTDIDALPYVDTQFNDPEMKKQVNELIQAELKTFSPSPDYLAHLPAFEPAFEGHPALQAEWMRVCEEQPMPQMDTTRYQMEAPPAAKQTNVAAWDSAVQNAQAQLEHQNNRLDNLELLQKYGSNLWRVHLNAFEAANRRCENEQAAVSAQIEEVNRKRKLSQTEIGPSLARLEGDWVNAVKKNLEIEGEVGRLQLEVTMMRRRLDPTARPV